MELRIQIRVQVKKISIQFSKEGLEKLLYKSYFLTGTVLKIKYTNTKPRIRSQIKKCLLYFILNTDRQPRKKLREQI
jgi:hypothetical protein